MLKTLSRNISIIHIEIEYPILTLQKKNLITF